MFEKMERITKICSADCLVIYLLTLFAQADLSVLKDRGRGGIYFGLGLGEGSNPFLEMTCLVVIHHIQKDS